MKSIALSATISILLVTPAVRAVLISGIEFPYGVDSFADVVVSFEPGPQIASPHNDPQDSLGKPNYSPAHEGINDLALGHGGSLILRFTDNLLVDQDTVENGLDLYIFERGGAVEPFYVSISKDGVNFISLGKVSGQPTGIDIAPYVSPGDSFSFVKIKDANSQLSGYPYAGADIDAVGAIGSIVPEPATFLLLGLGGLTLRIRKR